MLRASVEGVGFVGPGFDDWDEGRAILAGNIRYAPRRTNLRPPEALPPSERRRASRVVKVALAAGFEAIAASGISATHVPSVFSSSASDGQNCHEICQQLATDDRQISPTRFHNSVHNAPAGYWSIASGAMTSASVLCAHDASFGAGFIEAIVQVATDDVPVLLVVFDADYPEPLRSARPVPDAMGVALVLAPVPSPHSWGHVTLRGIGSVATRTAPRASLDEQRDESRDRATRRAPPQGPPSSRDDRRADPLAECSPDAMADPALETLRRTIPAARALPLLAALAQLAPGSAGTGRIVTLDYLENQPLVVEVGR